MSILELEDDKNVNINLHHLKYISKKTTVAVIDCRCQYVKIKNFMVRMSQKMCKTAGEVQSSRLCGTRI